MHPCLLSRAARVLVGLLLVGCQPGDADAPSDPLERRAPLTVGPAIPLTRSVLDEVSGSAADPSSASRIWMINDGGNPAELIAVDAAGQVERRVRVRDARNIDWEALAVGPCAGTTCLYIADVGDNDARRRIVTVYRTPVPPAGATVVEAERLDLQWPNGPDDVEAAAMDSAGTLWFVTKGRADGAQLLLSVPIDAWASHSCVGTIATPCRQGAFTALHRQTLTVPVRSTNDWITGAELRGDGRVMALRTYADLLLLPRLADGRLDESAGVRCELEGVQRQGESLVWLSGDRLLLTTEGGPLTAASQRVVQCPLPATR